MQELSQLMKSKDLSLAFERLAERSVTLEVGEILSYEELTQLTGLPRHSLSAVTKKVNADLLEAHRFLVVVRGEGYKLATQEEMLEHSDERRLRAQRQFRWALAQLQGIDQTKLSTSMQDRRQHLMLQMQAGITLSRKNANKAMISSVVASTHQKNTNYQMARLLEE